LTKSIHDLREDISAKEAQLETARSTEKELEVETAALSKKTQDLQRQQQAVLAGVAVAEEDAESTSFADTIAKAKKEALGFTTELKQAELKVKHLTGELKAKKGQIATQQKEIATLEKAHQKAEGRVKALKTDLAGLQFDPARAIQIETQKRTLEKEYSRAKEV
jgi:chromosome segregation ATPase